MGRVGAAGDNAAMESFFALLQNNVLNRRAWLCREQLRSAIVVWIEKKYHRKRRQAALGRLTPIEFETMMATPVALAARLKLSPKPASDPKGKAYYPRMRGCPSWLGGLPGFTFGLLISHWCFSRPQSRCPSSH